MSTLSYQPPQLPHPVAPGQQRWVAVVEYDGTQFQGWQIQQAGVRTVQGAVEQALTKVANSPVNIVCAGRTDAGVSAVGQVVHFDTAVARPAKAWLQGGNMYLPDDVNILWVRPAPLDFHARFSAVARTYRYSILNRAMRSARLRNQVTHWRYPLDAERMHQAAQYLLGENDFTSFRSTHCQANTPTRHVESVSVQRDGELIHVEITANAFLHHMVRNIVGVLLEIGQSRQPITWVQELLDARNRHVAGITAPAQGLLFLTVRYPDHLNP